MGKFYGLRLIAPDSVLCVEPSATANRVSRDGEVKRGRI